MVSNIAFSLTVSLSLIWLPALVSLYIWKPSSVSSILPFFFMWTTSIMSAMFPMTCLLSIRCCIEQNDLIVLLLHTSHLQV